MSLVEETAATSEKREPTPFAKYVGHMVSAIERAANGEHGLLNRGDVSALRRMDPARPAPAFWKLAAHSDGIVGPYNERKWAFVAKAIAVMAPLAHDPSKHPGTALRDAGWSKTSDIRMSRLLKAEDESFEDYALGAIRYLVTKGRRVNWFSLARFLVDRDDRARNRLASDFYSRSDN